MSDEFRDEFGFDGPMPVSSNQRRTPEIGFNTGPSVGETLPDFTLLDQTGRRISFHTDRAGSKAAVVFIRSVVWSPGCLTQLGELQDALPAFEAAGIKLYAISYDECDALDEFAHVRGIKYTLLSDPESAVVERFGILNTLLTPSDVPFYGVPFPGIYVLDEAGVVRHKFFGRHVSVRESAETVLDAALGRIGDDQQGPRARAGDDDARITVFVRGGGGVLKSGPVRRVVVRFALRDGLHLCASSAHESIVRASVEIGTVKGLHVEDMIVPPAARMALREPPVAVSVWSGGADLVIPIWADSDLVCVMRPLLMDHITLDLTIRYQLCDAIACQPARSERISLQVPLGEQDIPNLPQIAETGHTVVPMRALKYFQRLIRRGESSL